MVVCGVLDYHEARGAIDLDTILFLLGMMIVLACLELSGVFELVERCVPVLARSPRQLLRVVVLSSGALSAGGGLRRPEGAGLRGRLRLRPGP